MRFLLRLSLAVPFFLLPKAVIAQEADPVTARTVSAVTAEQKMVEWTLNFNGLFIPREEVAVGTTLQDQRIAVVETEIGDYVRAGQVLVRLDTVKLDIKLKENEGRVARARAALAQQKATQAQAQLNLDRAKRLRGNGAVSEQSYDDKLSAFRIAEQGTAVMTAELAQAEAQFDEAKSERDRAVLYAPVSGIVSERNARTGALAGNAALVSLIRDGEIEFAAEVPESELPFLKINQRAQVRLPDGRTVAGHIRLIAPKINRQTRLGTVYIAFDAENAALFSGAFGKAEVIFARNKAILVKDTAVLRGSTLSDTEVFIISRGKAVKRKVVLGMRRNGEVEIRSGLNAGDQIIEKAAPLLRDGEAVTAAPDRML